VCLQAPSISDPNLMPVCLLLHLQLPPVRAGKQGSERKLTTALGQEHQLIIKTTLGPWPQSIVFSISQTGITILRGSYAVY
jgi:hypothetical protein